MSRNFAGFPSVAYRGTTYRFPVKQPSGTMPIPNSVPPSVCPIFIDWNVYWQLLGGNQENIGVDINIQASSVQASILDRIASVKIDNTNSPNSVYVYFGDTSDVVTCPPYSVVTFPCLTNLLTASVFITGLVQGQIPQTQIFFYNSLMPPAVDPEQNFSVSLFKASPSIQIGTSLRNNQFAPAALGDQLAQVAISMTVSGLTGLLLPAQASGSYYITSITLSVVGLANTTTVQGFLDIINSLGTIVFRQSLIASAQFSGILFSVAGGMNLRWDATQSWSLRNVTGFTAGGGQVTVTYTYSPTG